jgi:hypothetical protein
MYELIASVDLHFKISGMMSCCSLFHNMHTTHSLSLSHTHTHTNEGRIDFVYVSHLMP